MSLKTRRRKMDRQHPPERVKRLERAAVRSFKAWATGWLNQKSLLDQLRKCDQPVSGRAITSSALFPPDMKTAGPE